MAIKLILLLTVMGVGNGEIDIVSVIPAKEYFQACGIDPTIDKLVEFAGVTPTSGKKQIAQLLALHQLAAEVESVKKSSKVGEVRQLLQQIAQGKKANDATGFAADYAKRALVALDGGKKETLVVAGWRAGAAWIPKRVSFLAGIDAFGPERGDKRFSDMTQYFGMMPKEAKEQLFDTIEKLGNFRVDRIVVGFRDLEKDNLEIFVRVTGKINPDWFVESYKGGKVEERSGGTGPKIHVFRPLRANGKGLALALVGDSDFLLAGIETTAPMPLGAVRFARTADVTTLNKMLALALKPEAGATQGTLKADLAKIPAAASGVAVGEVPPWMGMGAPFPMPRKIFAHAHQTASGTDMQMQATMDGEDSAKKLVQAIDQARDAALAHVDKLQGQPQPIPGTNLNSIRALLRSIQLRSEGSTVHMRLLVPSDAIMSIPAFAFFAGR